MKTKEVKIQIPEGYEIDKENSTFERIKFKPIKKGITYRKICDNLFSREPAYAADGGYYIDNGGYVSFGSYMEIGLNNEDGKEFDEDDALERGATATSSW